MNGFKIFDIARNGYEAFQKYKESENKPDIILMDYRMPIMNGLEASQEILQLNKNAKIIFASADDSIKDKVINLGISLFLLKPFNNETLLSNINAILRNAVV